MNDISMPDNKPVRAIKGFDKNLQCRGFQFQVGETYKHDGPVVACDSGFHVVTGHPLAVFKYYAPSGSRFCRVEIDGKTHSDDSEKTAAEILKVGAEIGLSDLIQDAVKWVQDRTHPEGEQATGVCGAASATGVCGAASATGESGAASATGDRGAASATGESGAAYAGHATATAHASGRFGRVMGVPGAALHLDWRREDGTIEHVWAGIVGRDGIQPDVWYAIDADGRVNIVGG